MLAIFVWNPNNELFRGPLALARVYTEGPYCSCELRHACLESSSVLKISPVQLDLPSESVLEVIIIKTDLETKDRAETLAMESPHIT